MQINGEESYRRYIAKMEAEGLMPPFEPDSVVKGLMNEFLERAKKGKQKYGTDLDRTDLSLLEWIQHFREEMMDGLLYICRVEQELKQKQNNG